jgi:hypothetical protein
MWAALPFFSSSLLYHFHGAKLGASGRGVVPDLALGRPYGMFGQYRGSILQLEAAKLFLDLAVFQ